MGRAAQFSLVVWAIVIFISPFFIPSFLEGFYFIVLLFSMLYSLPSLFLFILITYFLNQKNVSLILKKTILAVAGVASIWTSFKIAGFYEKGWWLPYCALLVIAVVLIKLISPEKPVSDE